MSDYDTAERVKRALVQAIVDDTDEGRHRWLHDPEYYAQVTTIANSVVHNLSVVLDASGLLRKVEELEYELQRSEDIGVDLRDDRAALCRQVEELEAEVERYRHSCAEQHLHLQRDEDGGLWTSKSTDRDDGNA